MQDSPVLELQALAQSGATPVTELLRRAKVVAVKLGLREAQAWIELELNGYDSGVEIPSYRRIPAGLMVKTVRGRQPVQFQDADWVWEHFSHADMRTSMAELAELCVRQEGILEGSLLPPERDLLERLGGPTAFPMVRIIPKQGVVGILETVRTRIMDWSLDLEQQGILGEGMRFSSVERERAAAPTATTINNFGPVVHGHSAQVATSSHGAAAISTNSSIGAVAGGSQASASGQSWLLDKDEHAEIRSLTRQLLQGIEKIPVAERGDLLEHGEDLRDETAKEKPRQSRLKATAQAIGVGLPFLIKYAPAAVEAYEKIRAMLGH